MNEWKGANVSGVKRWYVSWVRVCGVNDGSISISVPRGEAESSSCGPDGPWRILTAGCTELKNNHRQQPRLWIDVDEGTRAFK